MHFHCSLSKWAVQLPLLKTTQEMNSREWFPGRRRRSGFIRDKHGVAQQLEELPVCLSACIFRLPRAALL